MKVLPDIRVRRVEDLTLPALQSLGLRGLLLDVDETLVATQSTSVSDSVMAWIESLHEARIQMAIVSNGHPQRVAEVARTVRIPATPLLGKPLPRAFHRGLQQLRLDAHEVAMVGDQVFTDVVGAHWAGLRAILVSPRTSGGLPHTRLLRRIEQRILAGTTMTVFESEATIAGHASFE